MYNKDRYKVEKCGIRTRDLSDHSPVYITVDLSRETKATLWRLNTNELMGHMEYEFMIEIQIYLREDGNGEVSPSMLWDAIRGK